MRITRSLAIAIATLGLWQTGSTEAAKLPVRAVFPDGQIAVQDLLLKAPAGWQLQQDAISDGTLILGFAKGNDYFTLYVAPKTGLDMNGIFVNGSNVDKQESTETHGTMTWKTMSTSKTTSLDDQDHTFHVAAFWMEKSGYTYYGYARSEQSDVAESETKGFLDGLHDASRPESRDAFHNFSLTGKDYTGKKYYFGFGDSLSGEMGNEVKYDIRHTHDIFTKDVGGEYTGTTQLEDNGDGHDAITQEWSRIKGLMTSNDMYVQYSSGHGSHDGLMSGVSYDEIRDNALSLPAKEIIIFTMACFSGNLVSSFDDRKDVWGGWQSQGRTLMVMASSRPDESSSTGPGTDPDEPDGPDGSAGSAFGYSLWKALIGYSDGYVDGVKDGFISLGEIRDYTRWKTQDVGGHTPVITGAFNPSLIMNRVPSKAFLASLQGGTEGLSDAEVMRQIRELDAALRVH